MTTGLKRKRVAREIIETFQPSTMENIDFAFYDWLDKELNIFCTTNEGWKKIPIIWAGQERAFQEKSNRDLRDAEGTIKLPIISISRKSVAKDLSKKGPMWANIPEEGKGGSYPYTTRIKADKTADFRREQSLKTRGQINFVSPKKQQKHILYETIWLPQTVYIENTYAVEFKVSFMQQMNEILQVLLTKTGSINYFVCGREGHMYEGFMPKDLTSNIKSALEKEERVFPFSFEIRILGYLMGADSNNEKPKVIIKENIVEVKTNRERTMFPEDIK